MKVWEVKRLNNDKPAITVLCDTREIRSSHLLASLSALNIPFRNKKLDYSDYSFEYNGKSYENVVGIERKATLTELSGNLTSGRVRFETEFAKAVNAGCKVTLLIEDENGRAKLLLRQQMDKMPNLDEQKKFAKTWRSKFSGNAMIASIKAFKDRYDLDLVFCSKKKTAEEMLKVFYKALEDEQSKDIDNLIK